MNKTWLLLWLILFSFGCQPNEASPEVPDEKEVNISKERKLQNGDIIFQTSQSSQSLAIQKATKSKYSHIGILYQKKDGSWQVFEAVQPVKLTPLQAWINRGKNKHYVIKRLKNHQELLTKSKLQALKKAGEKHLGKDYDLLFDWSDRKMYCSELVWKVYKEALGIELGKLQTLASFDLSDPTVQRKLKQRYGDKLPLNEQVIAPQQIFESAQLKLVFEN